MSCLLITGTSKGIGLQLALHFLDQGHQVIGLSRSHSQELDKKKNFFFYACDLLNTDELEDVATVIGQNHQVDVFIHNAMFTPKHRPFLRYKAQDYLSAHTVATVAPAIIVSKICSSMRKQHYGRMLFIGSVIQLTGSTGQLAYLCAKSALSGLTKGLALELASSGITTNTLLLGPVLTEKLQDNVGLEQIEKIKNSIPSKEFVTFEQIIHSITYLMDPKSQAINGTQVIVGQGSQLRSFH